MTPPREVRAAWGWDRDADVAAIPGGLINATFAVRRGGAPIAVLQRVHPVFAGAVNLDIEAVTRHLAAHGLATPLLVRTLAGDAWVEHDGVWRALSWVDGETVHTVPDLAWAEAGGELVGRFHRAVADLEHDYHFARAGVHDTAGHLARLSAVVGAAQRGPDEPSYGVGGGEHDFDLAAEARDLGAEVLAAAAALPALPSTRRRHCHGDLKISNVRFDGAPPRALALVDLDTVGIGTLAFELGDAMRSWCNTRGEDHGTARFELPVFAAAMGAWRDVAGALATREELASVVLGLETVCVELAARFCVDVFEDRYFGWDPARFSSRREHDLVRARGQLALARSVGEHRDEALEVMLR